MGIFARLAQLIRSNLNDLISRSEDPEKMLNQVVIEMGQQLIEAKKQVAVSIADEKRLAKEALARKKEHEGIAKQYEDQWQKQKEAVDQLKTALRLLNNKIEEAKRKKNVLIARKKRAEAQKAIQETMSGLRDASAFETFDRMAQKIDQMEAETEAGAEIAEEYTGDMLAQKFAKMETTSGAEDDLMALKRKMGLAPPEAPAAPAPQAQMRVAPEAEPERARDQEELAAALAELEAQEQQEQQRMKR